MPPNYTTAQIRDICKARRMRTIQFFIPLEISGVSLTLKISYWHERDDFVAEPGTMEQGVWHCQAIEAPVKLIGEIQDYFNSNFAIQHIAGIVQHGSIPLIAFLQSIVNRGK